MRSMPGTLPFGLVFWLGSWAGLGVLAWCFGLEGWLTFSFAHWRLYMHLVRFIGAGGSGQ